jgi:hypothetical protein
MKCGDSTIDGLISVEGTAARPLNPGDYAPAVGYLHDLLRGHGYAFLPDPRSDAYRSWESATSIAVQDFRRKRGLVLRDCAGGDLLRELIARPAPNAVVGGAYVPLVLNTPFSAILRFVWLTSLFKTGAAFEKLNLNTGRCGVSFGILQWSQRSGELHRLLRACAEREPEEWMKTMEDNAVLDYTARPDGGVDGLGNAADPAFDLTEAPWKPRLKALGANLPMQRIQLAFAAESYGAELDKLRVWASAITSERGLAFLLDLANQFGAGRVEQQYRKAAAGFSESKILKAMEDAFVDMARLQFQPRVRARREFFRTTELLSDDPLIP